MKIDNNLSDLFELEEPEKIVNTNIVAETGEIIENNPENNKLDSDYNTARGNLHVLLTQGQDALMNALEVAKQSEHPRAFEVVGNLVKQLADVNQQLLDLHKQKDQIENPKGSKNDKQVTNNNAIFVGSTSELNKLISNMNKGD